MPRSVGFLPVAIRLVGGLQHNTLVRSLSLTLFLNDRSVDILPRRAQYLAESTERHHGYK